MEEDLEIVASCRNGQDALDAVRKHGADILVLDIRMPGKDGLITLREIHDQGIPVKVVFLTAELREEDVIQGVRLGVKGIVLKEMAPQLLVQCLRKVHGGGQWIERHSFSRAMEKMLRREEGMEEMQQTLTVREVEIVRLVAQGFRNRKIAEELFISEGTVKIHLHNIFKKLGVQSRSHLMRYAQDKGLT